MSDWRLTGQENYLADKTLFQVVLPDFWKNACREKNDFFHMIADGPVQYVKEDGCWIESRDGENVSIDWHEHCDFCWEKAELDKVCTFYCTKDMRHWICDECFRDFREKFRWRVLGGEGCIAQLTEEEEDE